MYSKIKDYLEMNISDQRLQHSLSTALICVELCSRFGVDEGKGRIAGIAHDISREIVLDSAVITSLDDGYPVTDQERQSPVLLHGRVGAAFLKDNFNLDDNEILQAVRWHTAGHPDMGRLGQILFVADYIEPGRSHISHSFRELIMKLDLNKMSLKILTNQTAYLRDRGYDVSESSMQLYDKLSNFE